MNDDIRHSDAGLDALERTLDELARRERALPDDGFEDRVMGRIGREALAPLGRPIPIARSRVWRSPWAFALAASLLVVLSVALFLWAGGPTQGAAPGETFADADAASEVDEFIETVAWLEASLPDFAADLGSTPGLDDIEDLLDEAEQSLLEDEESI